MEEDLEHGLHRGAVLPQHPEAVLAALSEHPLHASRSEAVHNVPGQAEWNGLGCRQDPALFKRDPEINMDNFSLQIKLKRENIQITSTDRKVVDEDVVCVSVPEAEDVAHHGVDSHGPGVGRH